MKIYIFDEWIRTLWYVYTMEYYSVIKRNEFESGELRWTNLKPIIQSEERERNILYINSYMECRKMIP